MRVRSLRHQERTASVRGKHGVPLLGCNLLERCGLKGAGVVDQEVQTAQVLRGGGDRAPHRYRIGHIARDRARPHANALQFRNRVLHSAVHLS